MCALYQWLFQFFLTIPGMAVIVIVCVGNGIACRAKRAYSNAIGLTMLCVIYAPLILLSLNPGDLSGAAVEAQRSQTYSGVIAVVLLIWVPVLFRWIADRNRPPDAIIDQPTGGFPVIMPDDAPKPNQPSSSKTRDLIE